MSDTALREARRFQQKIYRDLDEKLKSTPWNSGASEAHGLLTGLACRGIRAENIASRVYLFRVDNPEGITLFEGMFELVLRDLQSEEPTFNLLLPPEEADNREMAFAISDWCEGFLQGFCFDGETEINRHGEDIQELINDMIEIGRIDVMSIEENNEEDERSLVELEEYLRAGIQGIYDSNVHPLNSSPPIGNRKIH